MVRGLVSSFGAQKICYMSTLKVDLLPGDWWVTDMDVKIPVCLFIIGDIFFLCHLSDCFFPCVWEHGQLKGSSESSSAIHSAGCDKAWWSRSLWIETSRYRLTLLWGTLDKLWQNTYFLDPLPKAWCRILLVTSDCFIFLLDIYLPLIKLTLSFKSY